MYSLGINKINMIDFKAIPKVTIKVNIKQKAGVSRRA